MCLGQFFFFVYGVSFLSVSEYFYVIIEFNIFDLLRFCPLWLGLWCRLVPVCYVLDQILVLFFPRCVHLFICDCVLFLVRWCTLCTSLGHSLLSLSVYSFYICSFVFCLCMITNVSRSNLFLTSLKLFVFCCGLCVSSWVFLFLGHICQNNFVFCPSHFFVVDLWYITWSRCCDYVHLPDSF